MNVNVRGSEMGWWGRKDVRESKVRIDSLIGHKESRTLETDS